MKLHLHIGTEKTGTTTIQNFLNLNRGALSEAGILVPRSLGETNHRLLAGIANNDDVIDDLFKQENLLEIGARRRAKERWWRLFMAEVSKHDLPRAVVSSEHLQSRLRADGEVQRLHDLLSELFHEIKVVLYIRSPIETVVSLYSTAVKYGSTAADIPPPGAEYFRNIVHHQETIQRWSKVFGQSNIIVKIFERQHFPVGSLVADFSEACEFPSAGFESPPDQNESLSLLGIEILRRINREIPVFLDEGGSNPARRGIVSFFEKSFSCGTRYTPSRGKVDEYEEAFQASNEWVRRRFFPKRDRLFKDYYVKEAAALGLQNAELDRISSAMSELWRAKAVENGH